MVQYLLSVCKKLGDITNARTSIILKYLKRLYVRNSYIIKNQSYHCTNAYSYFKLVYKGTKFFIIVDQIISTTYKIQFKHNSTYIFERKKSRSMNQTNSITQYLSSHSSPNQNVQMCTTYKQLNIILTKKYIDSLQSQHFSLAKSR